MEIKGLCFVSWTRYQVTRFFCLSRAVALSHTDWVKGPGCTQGLPSPVSAEVWALCAVHSESKSLSSLSSSVHVSTGTCRCPFTLLNRCSFSAAKGDVYTKPICARNEWKEVKISSSSQGAAKAFCGRGCPRKTLCNCVAGMAQCWWCGHCTHMRALVLGGHQAMDFLQKVTTGKWPHSFP